MITDKTFFSVMLLVCGISFAILLIFPFSIAVFYGKVFKKRVYPFIFIISGIMFAVSFLIYSYDIFNDIGSGLFALGGILLAAASARLYFVMMGRR